jgi:hypothetical protein
MQLFFAACGAAYGGAKLISSAGLKLNYHTFNRCAMVLLPRSKECNKKSAQLLATKVI